LPVIRSGSYNKRNDSPLSETTCA